MKRLLNWSKEDYQKEVIKELKKGTLAWNKWREGGFGYNVIDLRGANLAGINLNKEHFSEVIRKRFGLKGKSPIRANLREALLDGADFSNAKLSGVDFSRADLGNAKLYGADLEESNLENADLHKVNLSEAYLAGANLRFADLKEADFSNANLRNANLCGAHLNLANLKGAKLWETDLSGADLRATDFWKASLDEVNFTDGKVGQTKFLDVDLGSCIGLETIHHFARSHIDTNTIQRSRGKIPLIFLRGCGLSDLDIEYARLADPGLDPEQVTDIAYKMHQLYVKGGVVYYSCFISYSSKDEKVASRLYNDLQKNGVRCWFAPEDLKIGDPIRPTIDQQIQLRDKLLVILSEESVKSEWVGDEVESALEEEAKSQRLVLFPIRLDDAVMNIREDWAAKIRRRRHIGDFSKWFIETSYQKAFGRLLRDLKSTEKRSKLDKE